MVWLSCRNEMRSFMALGEHEIEMGRGLGGVVLCAILVHTEIIFSQK